MFVYFFAIIVYGVTFEIILISSGLRSSSYAEAKYVSLGCSFYLKFM